MPEAAHRRRTRLRLSINAQGKDVEPAALTGWIQTSGYLRRWIAASRLSSGPLFRALHLDRVSEGALCTSSIRRIVKRALGKAGYSCAEIGEISGHSMRIGAAQDMMVAGFDALSIMQAGGWKSTNVVLRYVENAASQDLHEQRWQRLQTSDDATARSKMSAKRKHVNLSA